MRHLLASLVTLVALPALALGQSQSSSVNGTVVDSIHARPLAGATVIATPVGRLRDTVFHSAVSDAQGTFALSGLLEGRYVLTVEHPWIDSTGIGAPPREIDVPNVGSVALAIPSAATLRRVFCPAALRDTSLGVMLGTVRRSDRTVPGAVVVFTWSDIDVDRATAAVHSRQVTASVQADSVGVYRACGLPVARSLLLQAQTGAEQSGVVEEQIGEAGLLVRDLALDARSAAPTPVAVTAPGSTDDTLARLGKFVLSGHVQSSSGQPVASAQIHLFGTTHGTVSSDGGDFRLANLPGGTQGFEILALGYYPRRLRVEMGDRTAPITVKLDRVAVVLDSLRVIAKRVNNPHAGMNREFDDRSRHGPGRYLSEDDIARRKPFETADLFKILPGVRVSGSGANALLESARGVLTFQASAAGQSRASNASCPLAVFIDGLRVGSTDVNTLSPEELHGVEIYSSATMPVKYGIAPCGAVLFWTK